MAKLMRGDSYKVKRCACDLLPEDHARMLYVDLREQPYQGKACCEGEELYHQIESGQQQDFKAVAYSDRYPKGEI